jgi:hypothetical protein
LLLTLDVLVRPTPEADAVEGAPMLEAPPPGMLAAIPIPPGMIAAFNSPIESPCRGKIAALARLAARRVAFQPLVDPVDA